MHRGSTTSFLFPGFAPAVRHDAAPALRAYVELKRRILTCRIAPGEPIDEKALSIEIRVPRHILREACDHLARERLVSVSKRGAFTVSGLSLADIRELCELRRIVEAKTAALAAERVRPEQVARLLALTEQNHRPGQRDTYEHSLKTNLAFHGQLARAAGNAKLEAVVVSVLDQMQRPLFIGFDAGPGPDEVTAEHLRIVDAVRRKRPALAYRLMWEHMADAEKEVLAACRENVSA